MKVATMYAAQAEMPPAHGARRGGLYSATRERVRPATVLCTR